MTADCFTAYLEGDMQSFCNIMGSQSHTSHTTCNMSLLMYASRKVTRNRIYFKKCTQSIVSWLYNIANWGYTHWHTAMLILHI